jgi:hypothetical protein
VLSAGTRAVAALSAVSLLLFIAVATATGDRLAVTLLFFAVPAFAALAGAVVATSGVGDRAALAGAAAAPRPVAGRSFGPVVVALGAGVLVLGAALGIVAYAAGAGLLAFGGLLWFSAAWRDHPHYRPAVSSRVSDNFSMPFGLPVAALVFIGVVAIALSRPLLAASKDGSPIVAILVAALILVGGVVAAAMPKRSTRTTFLAALVLFLIAVLAIGLFGWIKGERETEHEGAVAVSVVGAAAS